MTSRFLFASKTFDEFRNHVRALELAESPIKAVKKRPKELVGLWTENKNSQLLWTTFKNFDRYFNNIFQETSFRIQERESTEISTNSPPAIHGVTYDIFYNTLMAGGIEIKDNLSSKKCEASASFFLWGAVAFPIGDVRSAANFVLRTASNRDRVDVATAVQAAILDCLWEQTRHPKRPASLVVHSEGSYKEYFDFVNGPSSYEY